MLEVIGKMFLISINFHQYIIIYKNDNEATLKNKIIIRNDNDTIIIKNK
jgi:hypothetical protein